MIYIEDSKFCHNWHEIKYLLNDQYKTYDACYYDYDGSVIFNQSEFGEEKLLKPYYRCKNSDLVRVLHLLEAIITIEDKLSNEFIHYLSWNFHCQYSEVQDKWKKLLVKTKIRCFSFYFREESFIKSFTSIVEKKPELIAQHISPTIKKYYVNFKFYKEHFEMYSDFLFCFMLSRECPAINSDSKIGDFNMFESAERWEKWIHSDAYQAQRLGKMPRLD